MSIFVLLMNTIVFIKSTIVFIMNTCDNMLGDLLFGQTRGRILALLYGHPEREIHIREIAREVRTSAGNVRRELETLLRVGLVHRSTIGSQVFYRANRESPVFAELHALVAKTVGVFQILSSALAPLAGRISQAFVYGSIARGDERAVSDVDLMVVGDATLDDVLAHLATAERTIGRPINPTVYSQSEFAAKLQSNNHFLNAVMRGERIFLIGEDDELRACYELAPR